MSSTVHFILKRQTMHMAYILKTVPSLLLVLQGKNVERTCIPHAYNARNKPISFLKVQKPSLSITNHACLFVAGLLMPLCSYVDLVTMDRRLFIAIKCFLAIFLFTTSVILSSQIKKVNQLLIIPSGEHLLSYLLSLSMWASCELYPSGKAHRREWVDLVATDGWRKPSWTVLCFWLGSDWTELQTRRSFSLFSWWCQAVTWCF